MSFHSPSLPSKFYQPINNFSSPNLYVNFNKSDISIKLDKNPPYPVSPNSQSQREATNPTYRQINNNMYTTSTSRPINGARTGARLNQMTSDLAKLKQQLSKIMTQAGTLQKRPQSVNQQNGIRNYQQIRAQSFKNERFSGQSTVNQLTVSIDKREEVSAISFNGRSPQSHQRVTDSSKNITQQTSPNTAKLHPSASQGEKKPQKVVHSDSEKKFGANVSKFQIYGTSYDVNDPAKFQQYNKSPEKSSSGCHLGKDYDIKPVLKVRNEHAVSDVNLASPKNELEKSTNDYEYFQQTPKSQQKILNSNNNNVEVPMNQPSYNNLEPNYSSERPSSNNSPPFLTTKSFSNFSHQLIVNSIVNEELSKKIQENLETSQLNKKKHQDDYHYQQKIIELEHEKRKIKHQINRINLEKENLEIALKTETAQKQALNKKYLDLQQTFKSVKFQLQQSKTRYKVLQRKLQSQTSRPKVITEQLSFDQVLKQQILQITKLKQQLENKEEQIMRVKDINTYQRRQIESLHNQIKIQQLKAASQLNQSEQKHSIVAQDKENEIKTMKNLVITLQSKLDCAIKENKTKDAFMVQHLKGKTKTGEEKEYIENFLKFYEIEFPTNRIADKLKEELSEIKRLKKAILEMAGKKM